MVTTRIDPCIRRKLTSCAHFIINLTFNFNSLLGIVYVSFSMQFPTVYIEECDFDWQILFDDLMWPFLIVTI